MIRLDFGTAVGFYVSAALMVFIWLWWFSFRRQKAADDGNMTEHIKRCPYCGHVFIGHTGRSPMKCPLCQSYLEVPDADQVKEQ